MLETMTQVLNGAGKSTECFVSPDGTRLLLLPYGARVFGLFSATSQDNFFWTNPPLDNVETARKLFADSGWHNTGGDRTWIAPELDTFYPDANFSKYWQPRQLDMSDYAVERTGGGVQLSREMTLHLARTNRDANLRLTKWYGPATNPLRDNHELAAVLDGVAYAGYTQRITLESLDGSDQQPPAVGIWNLIQLPAGGEMFVPVYARTTLQPCFGDMPAKNIVWEDHLLRVKMDMSGSHKVAIKAASLCGRAGYVYDDGKRWSLIVRNFFANPSGKYVDVQRQDLNDKGYGFQVCRVDEPDFGSFCELEYHAPALGSLPDPMTCNDVSQVWAFRGSREAVDTVARNLLGVKL